MELRGSVHIEGSAEVVVRAWARGDAVVASPRLLAARPAETADRQGQPVAGVRVQGKRGWSLLSPCRQGWRRALLRLPAGQYLVEWVSARGETASAAAEVPWEGSVTVALGQ